MSLNELEEINIDTLARLNFADREIIKATRREWIKRQRKQEKKEIEKIIRKKNDFFYTKNGLCWCCKEHEQIHKAKLCKKCWEKERERQKKRRQKKSIKLI